MTRPTPDAFHPAPSLQSSGQRQAIRLDGLRAKALDVARSRLLVVGMVFAMAFLVVAGRLIEVTIDGPLEHPRAGHAESGGMIRADILDRNGIVLATSLPTASLYADPEEVLDADEAADALVRVLTGVDRSVLAERLRGQGRFVYIKRHLTPKEQFAVNRLGLPGIAFQADERRVYPQGSLAAHILGFCDVDNTGLAGVERMFGSSLANGHALPLTLDIRIQSIVRAELAAAVKMFRAIGGTGIVLDARTGAVMAMVSLPDFDPNAPGDAPDDTRFNRAAQGVYELGSTFKVLTAAMALDSGVTSLESGYDASRPIRVSRYSIRDFHAQNKWLSVPEILVHSSNIGAAHMALDVGSSLQRKYLGDLGLLTPAAVELPEVGEPLVPKTWRDVNTMTIGFGHGIAVSPLQLTAAFAAVANGGVFRDPTLIQRRAPVSAYLQEASMTSVEPEPGRRVFQPSTSEQVRALMRLVVLRGTGRKADIVGLRLGGKTGTAEKQVGGRYRRDARISSFIGVFPIDAPRYVVMALLDEPKGTKETHNYATGGWVAAPLVGSISARIAPLLGVEPAASDLLEARNSPRTNARKRPVLVSMQQAINDTRGRRVGFE